MKKKIIFFFSVLLTSIIMIPLMVSFSSGAKISYPGFENTVIYDGSNKITQDTVIIADSEDSYYPLALEIAESEKAIILQSVKDLDDHYPAYIIWVTSPQALSEKRLLALSSYYTETGRFIPTGIITGLTIDSARSLWEKSKLAKEGDNFIAGDYEVDAGFKEGFIIDASNAKYSKSKLDKETLINTLEDADYLYWARHVSPDKWFWHNSSATEGYEYLNAEDIPLLKPVIIHTPSCSSFTPWENGSIALGFIEKGASAYLGDLFSPTGSGITIGHLQYLAGKYTWEGFPLGIVAQIQNKYINKISTNAPNFFMLGNPKIYLQDVEPYSIISDETDGDKRIITLTWDHEGILPLKIKEGAGYSFIRYEGSETSDKDLFYHSKIQSIDIGSDKYLLLLVNSDRVRVELSKKTPFIWIAYDAIRDSFEYCWITIGVVQGYISLAFFCIFLLIFLIYRIKRRIPLMIYLPPILAGLVIALLQVIYIVLQRENVTVISILKTYTPLQLVLGFIGTFSTVSGGLMLMLAARKKILKVTGMVICILPQLALLVFKTLMRVLTNMTYMSNGLPAIWNYSEVYQVLIVIAGEITVFTVLYLLFRWYNSKANEKHR